MPPGPFLVCGLARSGQSVARLLASRGNQVLAVDSAAPEGAAGLASDGVEVHLDAQGDDLVSRAATVVKSPGVPGDAPVIRAARSAGVPVVGELEIGWRATSGHVVAVTGTNGKTTVTEMIGHALRAGGTPVEVVGNVGRPISSLPGDGLGGAPLVVEASSFQLEDCESFAPDVAVFLNLRPDHLDRHGTMEAYRAAKLRIFAAQEGSDSAVLPHGSDVEAGSGAARRITFGEAGADAEVDGGSIRWKGEVVVPAGSLPVPGRHNLFNAAAAVAACVASGADPEAAGSALSSFPGVPHRLERVAVVDGVSWVNDSKATNVDSALTAVEAIGGRFHLIAGGQGKGQDFSPLVAGLGSDCVGVHLIGEAAGGIAAALGVGGFDVDVHIDGTLDAAVASCAALAGEGDVVLLAPACASFDQFNDFEHRGRRFAELVREMGP